MTARQERRSAHLSAGAASPPARGARRPNRAIAGAVLLAALTVLVYVPAMRAQFIWDDDDYVQNNQTLRSVVGLSRIWFQIGATPQYYPLVHTSYWIEYHLWGLNPTGYHLVNILLHALGAILLWRVLTLLGLPGAWVAAAIFALHPVQVESVAWITERKNVLAGVCYFGSALAYFRFALPQAGNDRPGHQRAWYCLALALYVCALFSKTVTCSLPAAVLLVLWWKRGRLRWRDAALLIPFVVLGLGFGILTAVMEKYRVGAFGEEWDLSFVQRVLIAGRVLWFYAGKLVFPAQLVFIYPRWHVDPASWPQYLFPLTAVAVLVLMWLGRRRFGRGPLAAILLFVGTLFPALGFFNVYPMRYSFVADHFQYLAAVGLIVLAVAGACRCADRLGAGRGTVTAAAAVILAILGTLTVRQARIYSDLETLWTDTLRKNPGAWMAHNNLANLLREKGNASGAMEHLRAAMEHFQEAVRINPRDPSVHNNLAGLLIGMGRINEAIEQCHQALRLQPDYPDAHRNLALALSASGRTREAIEQCRELLRLRPNNTDGLNNLAWLLATSSEATADERREAVGLAEQAAKLANRDDPHVLDTLAAAYAGDDQFDRAVAAAQRAIALASAKGAVSVAAGIRDRLELYKQNKPYREPAPSSGPAVR
ncbi:MAG TPA: tetratricopeptide repeat protein [Phycisphaerae bacterium]|nr:tetratricopeptide repeat protein [Phycisphaerae bacterium]